MRNSFFTLVLVGSFVATSFAVAQNSTAPAKGWAAVEALNAGTDVHVIGRSHSTVCKVAKVDDSSLTCMGVGAKGGEVFQKADIKKVKLPRRSASTLAGLGIGAGLGAGIGAGVGVSQGTSNTSGFVKTSWVAGVGAVVFGLIGALIGGGTDFLASTIYRS